MDFLQRIKRYLAGLALILAALSSGVASEFVIPSFAAPAIPTGDIYVQGQVLFARTIYREDESQTALIEVVRINDLTSTSSVEFFTQNSTAIGRASCDGIADFIATTETIVFLPGEASKLVSVQLCSDPDIDVSIETLSLRLTGVDVVPGMDQSFLQINKTASTYRNVTPIQLTSGRPSTMTGFSPYPSTINVTDSPSHIGGVMVTLYDLWHVIPDNIDVLLVGPGGQKYILMGDAGGSNAIGPSDTVTLTFRDVVPFVLPDSQPLTTRKSEPTNWESPVTNFLPPASPGPYTEPGHIVGGPIETTMYGTFGEADSNGIWQLYIRDDGGNLFGLSGAVSGGWGLEIFGDVSISGRVLTSGGLPIRNANVFMFDKHYGKVTEVVTGSFGYFTFGPVLNTGYEYEILVGSRRFVFEPSTRIIRPSTNVSEFNFFAQP